MLEQQAQQILEAVKDAGAEGDLIIDAGRRLSLKAHKGELEEHKVSHTQTLGLRLIRDGRVGIAYSEATDPQALEQLVGQALTNAAFAEVSPEERIADQARELHTDEALLCPPDNIDIGRKIEWVLTLEAELRGKSSIQTVPHTGLVDGLSERALYTTGGLRAHKRARRVTAYTSALAAQGERTAMGGDAQAARDFADLRLQPLVERAWEEATQMLAGEPVPTGHYHVIFDQNQQASLFGAFVMALSGKAAKDGLSPWRDRLGEALADPRLSLWDQPLNTEGHGYELFDAEGSPCEDLGLLVEGRLESLLHNTATAAHFGTRTTGHAARGPRSPLGVVPHQLHIPGGGADRGELTAGEYLLITDLTGLHSGANALSGDFSFGASGFLCREGQVQQSVRGITVAGNFYRMLNSLACIGDTPVWNWSRSALMAPVRFADLAVSGS